jgi:hypothetical protein
MIAYSDASPTRLHMQDDKGRLLVSSDNWCPLCPQNSYTHANCTSRVCGVSFFFESVPQISSCPLAVLHSQLRPWAPLGAAGPRRTDRYYVFPGTTT